jgi:hypothetical protein
MAAGFHQKAWMIALHRWDAGRGSEKGQIEHIGTILSSVSVLGCHGANVETNYIPVGEALDRFFAASCRSSSPRRLEIGRATPTDFAREYPVRTNDPKPICANSFPTKSCDGQM